ncbi:hypothetical protein B296_00012257, partial [Ensete ventricosum]
MTHGQHRWRLNLVDDFTSFHLTTCAVASLAIRQRLHQHSAFHHFREERGISEPLRKHRELERLLREEYHSLEAFRAKEKAEKRLPEKSVAAAEAAAPMTQKSHHSCAVELLPALPIFYE